MIINAHNVDYRQVNEALREVSGKCTVSACLGQRFIAAGMSDKDIIIEGVPGNALGAYLNGASITVNGNAQDAVGDTMNDGEIVVHGSIGDAAGYAMRGGKIFVKGSAGYRAGIHMKAYKEKQPLIVIGGKAGSFLGEYQAGGTIIVLGISDDDRPIVGNYPSTGMHGGKIFLRCNDEGVKFPSQVHVKKATPQDMEEIRGYIEKFCQYFGFCQDEIFDSEFIVATPDSKNPYKQMYVAN